jgi:hypothetical protein
MKGLRFKMSKITDAIKLAKEKGYTADREGSIYGPRGNRLKLRQQGSNKRTYPHFGVVLNGQTVGVAAHKFISYLKFGEDAIRDGVHTRHLNDDPQDSRWENIAIGSHSDNMMDKPRSMRRALAQVAGKAKGLGDCVWDQVKADRANGATYKSLTAKYGIPKGTLSYRLSETGKRIAMKHPDLP